VLLAVDCFVLSAVERGGPQSTVLRMRIAWTIKARDTHSEYVIIIAFPLYQWLYECGSLM